MVRRPKGPLSHIHGLAASLVFVVTPVLVTLAAASVKAQAEVTPGTSPQVLSEGPNHFEILVAVPEPRLEAGRVGDISASSVVLPGWPSSAAEGAPMLPLRSFAFAVPEGEEFRITVEGEEPRTFSDIWLVPFRSGLVTDSSQEAVPARLISDAYYSADAFLPEVLYEVGRPDYLRDLRLVPVDVRPARYNPAARELQVYTRLRIRIETRGGTGVAPLAGVPGERMPGGRMWEDVYRAAVVNYPSDMARRAVRSRGLSKAVRSGDYYDSSARWLAVKVTSRGIYRIFYQDIVNAGVPEAEVGAIDPATLRLFTGDGLPIDMERSVLDSPSWMTEAAIHVEDGGDGRWDSGDKVLFYGLGTSGWLDYLEGAATWGHYHENGHTDLNVYWLTWGGSFESGPPKRMESRDGEPSGGDVFTPDVFKARVHREENRFWDPAPFEEGVKWERWWWQELSMLDPGGRVYKVDLANVATDEPCRLEARFWGTDFKWGCLPHHVLTLEFNDSDTFTATAQIDRKMDVDTTAVWAVEGENVLVARIPTLRDTCLENKEPPQYREDKCLFAWFELEYFKRFIAEENELAFDWMNTNGEATRFTASGFSTNNVRVLDVTDRHDPVVVRTSAISGGSVTFEEHLEGSRTNYYLLTDGALRKPAEIKLHTPGGLRTSLETPDYIVVGGEPLMEAARAIADWRTNNLCGITDEGLAASAEVVDIEDVYDEFSWGMMDPLAIRNFLEFRFRTAPAGSRPPSYALLLGEATWDFKDVYGLGVKNIVPSFSEAHDWRSRTQYSSDDFFVLFEGPEDRHADMAVGRISAEEAAEAMDVVTKKIIGFEREGARGPWRNRVILAADDACKKTQPEGLGQRHTDQVDDLSKFYLPFALDRVKIYMIDYGGPGCQLVNKPEARADFIDALNSGALLVNYVGHGSATVISDEILFLADDVAALTNEGKLGLFVTASCAVGKYDVPLELGMAEGMSRHPTRGALASYAATTLAYIPPNKELDQLLVAALLPKTSPSDSVLVAPTKSLGLVVMEAEAAFTNWTYFTPYKYVLLGDPASVIAAPGAPYYNDGSWMWVELEKNTADLAGGERDTLRGTVMAGDVVAGSFQGRVNVLVQGARETRYLSIFGPYHYPGPTLYRGDTQVVDGRFEVSWTNPYEIKTGEQGKVRAFVWNDGAEAVGALTGLEIKPPEGPPDDEEGPVIELDFETPGSAVTPGALLLIRISDSAGINMAPILAENGLFLRLYNEDLNQLVDGPVDLVEGFTYEEGSSSTGTVVYRLPTGLSTAEGSNAYRVEVSASDNFSNRSSVEKTFDLAAVEALRLTDVINVPNPFSGATTFSFRVLKEADVVIRVYTVGGRPVRTLRASGVNGWGHVEWDGRDEQGDEVSNGVYIYRVKAVTADGGSEEADAVGKAAKIR